MNTKRWNILRTAIGAVIALSLFAVSPLAQVRQVGNGVLPFNCTNGQVPVYNTTSRIWECGEGGGGSSFDQDLNTDDAVTFKSVTLSGFDDITAMTVTIPSDDYADIRFSGYNTVFEAYNSGAVDGAGDLIGWFQTLENGSDYGAMYLERQNANAVTAYMYGVSSDGYAGFWATGSEALLFVGSDYSHYASLKTSGFYVSVVSDDDDVFAYYANDLALGGYANAYYDWFDSRGVAATKEEFSQAVTRLYNPEFAKYEPGAADYERIFYGRWGQSGEYGTDNIVYLGAEAAGTGTLRNLNVLGAEVGIMSIPGTYATLRAGGYKSADGSTGCTGTPTAAKNGIATTCSEPNLLDQILARLDAAERELAALKSVRVH